MAFDITNLTLLTPHGRDTAKIWHYSTTDASTTVDTANYFVSLENVISVGDLIYAKCSDGYGFIIVNAVTKASAGTAAVDCNDMVPLGGIPQKIYLSGLIADVSTGGSIYLNSPVAGNITRLTTVLQAAISVADANVKLTLGTTDVTGGAVVVAQSGSAVGDVDTAVPSAENTVTARQTIIVTTDGGSTTSAGLMVYLEITPANPSTDTD